MIKGNLFTVSWGAHEDQESHTLIRPTRGKKNFGIDIKDIIKRFKDDFDTISSGYIGCSHIGDYIIGKLLTMGYTYPDQTEIYIGSSIITDESDTDEKNICGKKLFDMILANNKEVEGEMWNKVRDKAVLVG